VLPRVCRHGNHRSSSSSSSRRPWLITASAAVVLGMLAAAGVASAGVVSHPRRHHVPAAAAAAPVTCVLAVPPQPLTARGLATPYRLVGPHGGHCPEQAFVQGTVIDAASGAVSVYNPLVVEQGGRPAIAPTVPKLPARAVVGLWFGFNGDTLELAGSHHSLSSGNCVNGLPHSPFGQYAYCNAAAFFRTANTAIRSGKLKVPRIATARDGKPCPTTRDFTVVDQDQSDNVTTTYLVREDGRTAQNTAANRAALARDHRILANGSDNVLVDAFLDAALGCRPFTAPDLADKGARATSLALNELQARLQAAPVALTPPNDPMVLIDGQASRTKLDLYRAGVDQGRFDPYAESAKRYCRDLVTRQPARLLLDRRFTEDAPSPDPDAARNLFTFLVQRLRTSVAELGCGKLLGRPDALLHDLPRSGR
jgi:hypothetical protein